MALGRRLEAISILGVEVMSPRGLTGLACDTLAHSALEIKQVFELLADEHHYPIMLHCTQGKDRTGLVVVLLLLLLEVPLDAVAADYTASERELQTEMTERIEDIEKIGLGPEFAKCPPDFVEGVVLELDGKYGGIKRYLSEKVGLSDDRQRRIREMLLA